MRVPFRGLEQLRARLKGGAPLLASTSGARLCGRLWIVDLGDFGLTGGVLDAPAFCRGVCPPDLLSVTIVLEAPGGGSLNGVPLVEGGALLFPPGRVYEGWSAPGYAWLTAFLPRAEARRLVRGTSTPLPGLRGARVLSARVPRADLSELRSRLEALGLDRERRAPEALAAPAAAGLAELLRRLLVGAWARGAALRPTGASRRAQSVLERADRYLREHLAEPVYLAQLGAATRTPARTLEHVFQRRLGLTPMAYLTWLRMAAARRRLTDRRQPPPSAVTETAHAVGFGHLGRFAAAYRRTFGESPQETLRQYAGRSRRDPGADGEPGGAFDPRIESAPAAGAHARG